MAGRDVGTGALIEPKNMDKEASWSCRTDHAPDTVTHPMVGETENASHTEKLTSPTALATSASTPAFTDVPRPQRDTQQARILTMLSREEGASGLQIAEATGWAPHTVRGFLAGLE